MRFLLFIFFSIPLLAFAQKKARKDKFADARPRIMEVHGDSLRTDSVVIYETEIGYVMPDHSAKFKGRWDIVVMRRQAMAKPDSLGGQLEFTGDTLFNAYVGCHRLTGSYIIKGPTIKFTVFNPSFQNCNHPLEAWFVRLLQERVSYFGIDEKILYLKDVAYNIVFDCAKRVEEIR